MLGLLVAAAAFSAAAGGRRLAAASFADYAALFRQHFEARAGDFAELLLEERLLVDEARSGGDADLAFQSLLLGRLEWACYVLDWERKAHTLDSKLPWKSAARSEYVEEHLVVTIFDKRREESLAAAEAWVYDPFSSEDIALIDEEVERLLADPGSCSLPD